MKKSFYILITLLICQFGYSQTGVHTYQPGYWTFGLNAGFSYQSSDVDATLDGFGFGATLAKNLYYRPGAPIAFDLRGRLLFARQYGLDGAPSFEIDNNEVLNGSRNLDYINYPNDLNISQGFVYQNHQTDVGELALEGVIHLNKLRERTGIVANIFGGIGLDWYRTKTDQADANGNEYYSDYANLRSSNDERDNRKMLESAILDGDYESLADDFSASGKLGIMPSLGFELGYAFTDNFYIFGGHKVTWSGDNALDGQQWADDNNDLYHYTNFGLRWIVETSRRSRIKPPVIEIDYPYYTSQDVQDIRQRVVATIHNVENSLDVQCLFNGQETTFDFANKRFETDVVLRPGKNDVLIIATNAAGKDKKRVIFNYKERDMPPPPNANPPVVLITNPSRNPANTQQSNIDFTADVSNVRAKGDIELLINNQRSNSFQFNPSTGTLRTTIALKQGRNVVKVKARNSAGRDEASTVINYENAIGRPVVTITNPRNTNTDTDQERYLVKANIKNVSSKSDIRMTINGRSSSSFSFLPSREEFEANVSLKEGRNTIRITAKNRAGEASDEVVINYKGGNAPYVNITRPSGYSYETYQSSYNLQAQVDEVDTKNNIQFYLDGRRVYDFSFNARTGELSRTISLNEGQNDIRIKAINSFGEATDQVSIIRKIEQAKQPPVVNISNPNNNSTTQESTTNLRAQVKFVNSKNDIRVTVNGQRLYSFTFNASTERLDANVNLKTGTNRISVRAVNKDGEDEQTITVKRTAPQPKTPPVVDISKPNNNATTQTSSVELVASVKYVNSKSDIEVLINGKNTYSFSYNASQNRLTANINLRDGANTISVKASNNDGNDEDRVKVTYQKAQLPTVNITKPSNNSTSTSKQVSLSANTQHVDRKQDIQVYLNNKKVSNFSFSTSQQRVTATLNLNTGKNTVRVKVKNQDGGDEDQKVVYYTPAKPPTVNITKPSNNSNSASKQVSLSANTEHVDNKQDIQVYLNNKKVNNFSFSTSQQRITATLNLSTGKNTVRVKVKNQDGSDEDQKVVYYTPSKPPTVKIDSPKNNSEVAKNEVSFSASTQDVNKKSEIKLYLNGKTISSFAFNKPKVSTKVKNLKEGKNTIRIKVENAGGKDEETVVVYFKKPVPVKKPVVRIIDPSKSGSVVDKESYTIKASVQNVNNKNEISISHNKKAIKRFTFDTKKNEIRFVVKLALGKNDFQVTAKNKGGKAVDQTSITYKKNKERKPVINIESISQPVTNPIYPNIANVRIKATITGVDRSQQISLYVNGKIQDFTFDSKSKKFETNVILEKGKNELLLSATNRQGTTEERRTVEF